MNLLKNPRFLFLLIGEQLLWAEENYRGTILDKRRKAGKETEIINQSDRWEKNPKTQNN